MTRMRPAAASIPRPFFLGFFLGFVLGMGIGVALENLPVGIAIGAGTGLVFGNIVSSLAGEGEGDRWIRMTPENRHTIALIFLFSVLFLVILLIALFLLR
jgi:hypothetical protein